MRNLKSLFMFSTAFAVVVGFCISAANAETVWLDADEFATVAQGDGDYQPTNFSLTNEEVSLQANAMKAAAAKPQKETIDDKKLPTLTSEGSFLLPTYIMPEEQNDAPKTIASVDEQNPWRAKQQVPSIATAQKNSTGVVLKGLDAPKRKTVIEQDRTILAEIQKQNLDTNSLLESTAKRLAALENDVGSLSQQKAPAPSIHRGSVAVPTASFHVEDTPLEEQQKNNITVSRPVVQRAPLLLPFAPVRSVSSSQAPQVEEEEEKEEIKTVSAKKEYVDYILDVIARSSSKSRRFSASDEMVLKSIPKEMKISFLPNSADLSSQAFKWIKVFSFNPQRSVISAVEVRLSPENLDLQSRRFALIKGALQSNGVTARQIRFVFTDRDIDTVVLRNIELHPEEEFLYKKDKDGKLSQQIIQKW